MFELSIPGKGTAQFKTKEQAAAFMRDYDTSQSSQTPSSEATIGPDTGGQALNQQANPLSVGQRLTMGFGTKDANEQLLKKLGYNVLSNDPENMVVTKDGNTYNLNHQDVQDGRSFLEKVPDRLRNLVRSVSQGGTDIAGGIGPTIPAITSALGTTASEASNLIPGAGFAANLLKALAGGAGGGIGAGLGAAGGEAVRQDIGKPLMALQGVGQSTDLGQIAHQATSNVPGGAIAGAVGPLLKALGIGARNTLGVTSGMGGEDLAKIQANPAINKALLPAMGGQVDESGTKLLSSNLSDVGATLKDALNNLRTGATKEFGGVNLDQLQQKYGDAALFDKQKLIQNVNKVLEDFNLKPTPIFSKDIHPLIQSDLTLKPQVQGWNLESGNVVKSGGTPSLSNGDIKQVENFYRDLQNAPDKLSLQDLHDFRERAYNNKLGMSDQRALAEGAVKPSEPVQALWQGVIGAPMEYKDGVPVPNTGSGLRGRLSSIPEVNSRDAAYSNKMDIVSNLGSKLSDRNSENFLKSVMGGDQVFYRNMIQKLQNESGGLNVLDDLNNMRISKNSSRWLNKHPLIEMAVGGVATHLAGPAGGAATFAAMSPQVVSRLFEGIGTAQGATKALVNKLGVNPNFVRMFVVNPTFQRLATQGLKDYNDSIQLGTTSEPSQAHGE